MMALRVQRPVQTGAATASPWKPLPVAPTMTSPAVLATVTAGAWIVPVSMDLDSS